jgi:iron complex transport system substrate-binding protein
MGIGRTARCGATARTRRTAYAVASIALAWCMAGSLAACTQVSARDTAAGQHATGIDVTDDGGLAVHLPQTARRVVSLTPSATETLISIGATGQIVGRTRYDVAPEVASLPSVGGGVDPSVEAIVALHPDLVISWEIEKREERQKLVSAGVPVFILRTQDTTDVFRSIQWIGKLTGHDSAAAAVAASVRATLDSVHRSVATLPSRTVLFVLYDDPPVTAGPRTYIGQLISLAGGRSIFEDAQENWPTVAMEEIVRRDPDLLILPIGKFKTNPLDRLRHAAGWRDLRAVRSGHVATVPADLLNRPSTSIGAAAWVLRRALHPEVADTGHAPAPDATP